MKIRKCLVMIFGFILLASCTSCDSVGKISSLEITSLFNGNSVSLPIKGYQYFKPEREDGITFYSKKRYEDMLDFFSKLDEIENFTGYPLLEQHNTPRFIFFSVPDPDAGGDINDVFAVSSDYMTGKYGYNYSISSLKVLCRFEGDDTADYDPYYPEGITMLLPIHLTSDPRLTQRQLPVVLEGVEYETNYSIDDFINFYSISGWYQFKIVDYKLVIYDYSQEPKEDSPISENNNFDMPFPIEIVFSEHVDQTFFTIRRNSN